MVVIRLQRRGTTKKPHHRIVATEGTRSQRGRVLETLGYYDPSYNPPKFSVNAPHLSAWVSSGAQVSESLGRLLKKFKTTAAGSRQ